MVYYYHKLIENPNLKTVCTECKAGHRGCVACKKELIDEMIKFLKPIKEKRMYYEKHLSEVDEILISGTKEARKRARETMKKVRHNMDIDYFKNDYEN